MWEKRPRSLGVGFGIGIAIGRHTNQWTSRHPPNGNRSLYPLSSLLPLARHRHRHRNRHRGRESGSGVGNRDRDRDRFPRWPIAIPISIPIPDPDADADADGFRSGVSLLWDRREELSLFPRLLWTCPSCGPHKLETEGLGLLPIRSSHSGVGRYILWRVDARWAGFRIALPENAAESIRPAAAQGRR